MGGKIIRQSLEHPVVTHCNLRCHGCDHGSPLLKARFSSPEKFARDVSLLGQVLQVDTLRLLGGEPFLHPRLFEFVSAAKRAKIANRVFVWTNGTLLDRADVRVFEFLDGIRVSRYPGISMPFNDNQIRELGERFSFEVLIEQCDEFLECFPDHPHELPETTRRIFDGCLNSGAWSCHSFEEGQYFKCSRARYIRDHVADPQANGDWQNDGLIIDLPDLNTRLANYLSIDQPLAACRSCLGTSGERFSHRQAPVIRKS